jgi:D-tyrosyl-tRNA(Tyr) deacylase
MRAVVQRVSAASVVVDGAVVGSIGTGLLVLAGVGHDDGPADVAALASKLAGLRIFPDEQGKMNRSVAEAGGAMLVVSQFTLQGDVRRGRRPSFTAAAPPEHAEPLVDLLVERLRDHGVDVETGAFGAAMQVHLVNSGPVTLVVDVAGGSVV